MTKSITIQIPIKSIDVKMIAELDKMCDVTEGKHKFKVQVIDQQDEVKLDFVNDKKLIEVDSAFIDRLSRLGLPYKLN
jgi:hypothetical protein